MPSVSFWYRMFSTKPEVGIHCSWSIDYKGEVLNPTCLSNKTTVYCLCIHAEAYIDIKKISTGLYKESLASFSSVHRSLFLLFQSWMLNWKFLPLSYSAHNRLVSALHDFSCMQPVLINKAWKTSYHCELSV